MCNSVCSRACPYGTAGTPITVSLSGKQSDVVLRVHNAGHVPAEFLSRLFEPFHSAQNRMRSRTEGLGLGLYIVQQIVFAHGGTVDVDSTVDAGTTFCVSLPRVSDVKRSSVRPV